MDARRIKQNNLTFGLGDDALNLETSCLRLVRDGGDLLADKLIQQCRLTGIRPADEGDVAATVAFFCSRF